MNNILKSLLASLVLIGTANAADQVIMGSDGPVSNIVIVSPLTIEQATKWNLYSQVKPVIEKESVLLDTLEAKNQMIIVHSISYFKGSNGQLYAIINYLRPRHEIK
jgi:hypothetical protein